MKPVHFLLVEDNEGDIFLIKEALDEAKVINTLSIARDGEEAINFLLKKERFVNSETPDLILLDINLPKKNGHEVLHFIKNHDELKQLPVVILTTSSSQNDILMAYQGYSNCYVTKPIDVGQFLDVVRGIANFWITIVKLPK